MKAVVTGATGFIGKVLVQTLVENGIDVIAIVRDLKKVPETWQCTEHIQVVCSDLSELDDVRDISLFNNIELFFHLAWCGT